MIKFAVDSFTVLMLVVLLIHEVGFFFSHKTPHFTEYVVLYPSNLCSVSCYDVHCKLYKLGV